VLLPAQWLPPGPPIWELDDRLDDGLSADAHAYSGAFRKDLSRQGNRQPIAGWVAAGTERIAYAGLQIAFAFYYSLFPSDGYAPDTDLTHLRDRVVGILFGLAVTALVFHYIWPEREAKVQN